MTYSTTFRAGVRAALNTSLQAFLAANPTLLRQVYRARPASLNPPCAFVGNWREPSITLDTSIATRKPIIELIFVQGEYDNAETMDRQDVLTDAAVSYFGDSAQAHIASGVILSMSLDDTEITFTGTGGSTATYLTSVLTLALDIAEGGL